jgi:hypothetical protein
MASYLKFRDVSAAIQAGQRLASAGEALDSDVAGIAGDLDGLEDAVLKGTDSYSREFLQGYHTEVDTEDGKKPHNEALRINARKVSTGAIKIGNNVVEAATKYLWVDAVNGAAMFRSTQGG